MDYKTIKEIERVRFLSGAVLMLNGVCLFFSGFKYHTLDYTSFSQLA